MRKKVDARIRTLIENGVALRHRSMFVVVGDAGREQVVNLHYMLAKAAVKTRPSVLWCYKKELGFTSHRKKRIRQIKKMVQRGLLDPDKDDPFELFISATEINYCYYKDTARVLGNTFGMLVLQDFEAVTPNVLARTIETVEGGGLVVLLLKSMASLRQLYAMSMDAHARFRTEAHVEVTPRFNERFILSLASCASCLVVDDELNVLPISSHIRSIKPIERGGGGDDDEEDELAGLSADARELRELKVSLKDTQPVGTIVDRVRSLDQAKAVLTFVEAAADKTLRCTVALTAGRGRGKSAAMGLSIAAAVAYGYANIFVTSPSPENLRTLFEFVLKGFDALGYKEHTDFSIVESSNPELRKAVVRVNVFHAHRQTIQYIEPTDARLLSQAELLVIDEAAAIPLPHVRALLGNYLVFMASTINGYEGTGRALSLKLIQQLRAGTSAASADGAAGGAGGAGGAAPGMPDGGVGARSLRESTLTEPIRYGAGDPIEKWLHSLLCLDAASSLPPVRSCPHPSECELYWVDRDALFSYHSASEAFLQRMIALCVASHYKNSPNDLQLMSDAPAHQLFVLLGPVDVNAAKLPDVLAVVQLSLEGEISKESVARAMARGEAPSGDMIPWTMSQQFQEAEFASLSGARVVRIAVHPDAQHMGYGSRAVQQLAAYYRGDTAPLQPAAAKGPASSSKAAAKAAAKAATKAAAADSDSDADADADADAASALQSETLAPRASLPPLLMTLAQRPAERLDWLGASFGLTEPLFKFWHRNGFLPVYTRQTKNEVTGEHSTVVLHNLHAREGSAAAAAVAASAAASAAAASDDWLGLYCGDFRRRFSSLLGLSLRGLPCSLALSLLDPQLQPPNADEEHALSAEQLDFLLGPYDMKRLRSYARNLVDHRLVADLVPLLARLRFGGQLSTPLSAVQGAILLGVGLQTKSLDELESELGLPASQLLALFNKAVRKMTVSLSSVLEAREEATLPAPSAAKDASAHMAPLASHLSAELDDGARESLLRLEETQQQQQEQWLGNERLEQYAIRGTDDEWAAALPSNGKAAAKPPGTISVKGEARPEGEKKPFKKHTGGTGGTGGSKPKRQKKQ